MKPDRYEVSSSGRHRLSGTLQQRGSKLGLPTWGGFLFGGVFVAVGSVIVLTGTGVFHADPASVHAPYWVLTAAGASFAMGGLMVWGLTWRQFAAGRRRVEALSRYPNEPALADFPWHPDGFEVSEWPGFAKALALAIGLSIFLSMFNWWAFAARGPWMVKIIVGLFDAIALMVWAQAIQQFGRALKFGHSRIVFGHFPYRLSQPLTLRWQPGGGVNHINKGTFTLRCVLEWTERTGSGRSQSTTLIHDELWSATWHLDQARNLGLKDDFELTYELPPEAQGTQLAADRPVFWELEVKLDLPGLDFKETYLVPVYAPPTGSGANPGLRELTFACPSCSQRIACDASLAGTEISCPTCNSPAPVPSLAEPSIASWPEHPPSSDRQTSGLAIASLVCSLLSPVTAIGFLPGIICGHLAKSKLRRDPGLKGNGFATAGLVLGYGFFLLEGVAVLALFWTFGTAVKQSYHDVHQVLATNNSVLAQTRPVPEPNRLPTSESVPPLSASTNAQPLEAEDSEWTADIKAASFPNHRARGKLHGWEFKLKGAQFKNGDLKLTSSTRMILDVFHLDRNLEARNYEIQPGDDSKTNPQVKITWPEDGAVQTLTFNKGFGLKLEFAEATNRRIPCKIYLCLPDSTRSCVAGTFQLRAPNPQ